MANLIPSGKTGITQGIARILRRRAKARNARGWRFLNEVGREPSAPLAEDSVDVIRFAKRSDHGMKKVLERGIAHAVQFKPPAMQEATT